MSKKIVLMSVLLTMMLSLAGMSASTENVLIDTLGALSFLYDGSSYVPLKSTANFLGAPLRWDAENGQAIITYQGEELALTPNNHNALFAGQPVALTSPPVVINGVTYIPASALKKYYNVPVEWDQANSKVKIMGPNGWGTMNASRQPAWHGGPPPWAPAWGRRGYGTPGHQGKVKACEHCGYIAPGHSNKAKHSGIGKAKACEQCGYGAPGHSKKAKLSDYENGKAKNNKKDK